METADDELIRMRKLWPRTISEAEWRQFESHLREIFTSTAYRPKRVLISLSERRLS